MQADEPAVAVVHLVHSGNKEAAANAARAAGSSYKGIARFLSGRYSLRVKAAAAAAIKIQADYVPDDDVEAIAARLMEFVKAGPPTTMTGPVVEQEAIGCLAAFGYRLPVDIANQLLDFLAPLVLRESNHYRFTDSAMVAAFLACAKYSDSDISERGEALLVETVEQSVGDAAKAVSKLRDSEGAVDGLRRLAESGVRAAEEVLTELGIAISQSRSRAIEAAQKILNKPVGHERNNWEIGPGVQTAAFKMRTAYLNRETGDEAIGAIAAKLFEKLVALASDSNDKAESRSFAAAATRILNGCVSDSDRAAGFARMIALSDDPLLNHADLFDQSTMHRLSRFKFNTGSESLHLDFLFCAAALTRTEEEAEQVRQRMTVIAVERDMHDHEAAILSKVLLVLDAVLPVEIDLYAYHPARHLRQAAVICWARREEKDNSLVGRFVSDSDMTVRGNMAHSLARLNPSQLTTELEEAISLLQADSSATVRRLITGE